MNNILACDDATADGLVRRFHLGVWRYLRFLGCAPTLADDLTQETFLAALKQPWGNVPAEALGAYLRTIARNQFFLHARQIAHSKTVYDLELIEQVWTEFARDDGGDVFVEHLKRCVDGLENRARDAIHLFYRDERSRDEIASRLQMTVDGVKSLLRRTRDVLRQCVERKLAVGSG